MAVTESGLGWLLDFERLGESSGLPVGGTQGDVVKSAGQTCGDENFQASRDINRGYFHAPFIETNIVTYGEVDSIGCQCHRQGAGIVELYLRFDRADSQAIT